jgi:lysophospholipase L1-like esterase
VNRVANVALAVLAVVVFGAAVYVVRQNGAPAPRASAGTIAAQQTTAPLRSTPAPPSTSAPRSGATSVAGSPPASLGIDATSSTRPGPVVAFLGDDWTAGIGASSTGKRFTSLLAARLGIVERNFGVNGTGYAKSSDSGGPYSSRVDAVVAAAPAVVVVSGGRNDTSDDPATAAAHARALFATLHAKLPDAVLVAVAPFWGDSDLPPEMTALGAAVKQGVTDAGGTYVDIPDPIHGHPSFMADAADPDDQGYAAIASALEPQLALLLPH